MTVTPVIPRTICSRLGWAVTDAWVITRRDLAHWARQPGAVIASTLLFPVMIVLMFGYLLGGAMTVPGGGASVDTVSSGGSEPFCRPRPRIPPRTTPAVAQARRPATAGV